MPDDVPPALEALRQRGLRIVVVSNANGTLRAHLDRLEPDVALRRRAGFGGRGGREAGSALLRDRAAEERRARETTIHVGDLYYVDVMGARSAGLRGVLLDEANLRPDADCPRVRTLDELVTAIAAGTFN